MKFEYSTDSSSGQQSGPLLAGPGSVANWKDKAATTAMLAMAMTAGFLVADWEPSYIAVVPLGYLLWEPSSKLILDVLGKLPEKQTAEAATTLKLEYKTEDNRHWILADFPAGIELSHLQHIAKICLKPPAGEGANFSRRKVQKSGVLSQGQYEAIRDFFLETHFAFYKDEHAINLGIVLTERCNRLLKKSLIF